jgi:hypothetical protein
MSDIYTKTIRRLEECEQALITSGVLDVESHLRIILGEPDHRPLPLTGDEVDLVRLFAEDKEADRE